MKQKARAGEEFGNAQEVELMSAQAPRGKGAPVPDTEAQVLDEDEGEKPKPGNARGDEEKMKENRERLHVNDAHKTPEMEKRHRGTFP